MSDRSPILVSACLLGVPCRYDGKSQTNERVLALAVSRAVIPVCPEQLGGLPTPRPPAERRGSRIVTQSGEDVTEAFARGAREALRLARLFGCRAAVLKADSPSCGCGRIHDGSFTGRLVPGDGIAAALLKGSGVTVLTEADDLDAIL
jgi:uncharacterized protein YbbK (DUF523 family)